MLTEWLSRKRISCLCWKITRNLRHTLAPSDQRTKQKHGFPAVKTCLSQWNIPILQPTSQKCQRICLKCRHDSLRDTGPLQQMMRGQEEHCCPKQLTTQLRRVIKSRHTESIKKRWNNMGTPLFCFFLKTVLDQELQDAIEGDWARCPGMLLPAPSSHGRWRQVTCSTAAAQLWLLILWKG